MKKLKKALVYACTVTTLLGTTTAVYAGASKVLNGGGAKWTGGETSNGILYSNLYDMEVDGIQYKVTVWVDPDWSTKKEKSGTTDGKGKKEEYMLERLLLTKILLYLKSVDIKILKQ